MLEVGIVGLPNVGKSTLFNALTRTRKAESANYPFCTIEPNEGVVEVRDGRLFVLQKIVATHVVIPAAIKIVDIAGLVKGASQGEGLGNKFLSHIREVDAIIHVVRCFEDEDILHSVGDIDPIRDIEIITTELILADLQSVATQLERIGKRVRAKEKDAIIAEALLKTMDAHLNAGKPAYTMQFSDEERALVKSFGLLTIKPVIYACNVAESDLGHTGKQPHVEKVREYAKKNHASEVCVVSAQLEADLGELSIEESENFLKQLGVQDSGCTELIRKAYHLLGLASYFTAGEKEVRAWTFKRGMKAPECAGIIHTDFEKGFIKAEVVSYDDLVKAGSYAASKDTGRYRLEGREYKFEDGDVVLFRFNT